jgi:hypothetical protein
MFLTLAFLAHQKFSQLFIDKYICETIIVTIKVPVVVSLWEGKFENMKRQAPSTFTLRNIFLDTI